MRICIFIEIYDFGGPDTVLTELLNSWPEPADDFIIVANRYYGRFRPVLEERVQRPIEWVTAPSIDRADLFRRMRSSRWAWPGRMALFVGQYPLMIWNAIRMSKLFRRLKPDALLINNGGYPGGDSCRAAVLAGAWSGVPTIAMTVHSLAMVLRPWRWLPEQLVDRYIDRHAMMICVSKAALARLRKVRGIRQTGVVIPNGFTSGHTPSLSRDDLLQEFGLPPQAFVIALVGSYDANKGHQLLFESVAALLGNFPKIRLLLFGTGNQADVNRLHQLIHDHQLRDTVVMCGFRQNVTAYLGATDLLVLPSQRIESMPMVIIEAMALRVPVIASNVGGVGELVEDRVTGRLLPPGDSAALTDAIKQAAEHPETGRKWAEQAHEKYVSAYTGEAMARTYHHLLMGRQ
jgi:glycosyltransferase involved in cell wall biosynthesis